MRKLAVILALASTALATPAFARDKSWYVGAEGGGMIVEDMHYDLGGVVNGAKVDHHYGYDVDGTIGYDFGPIRIETEVGYRRAGVNGYTSSLTTPTFTATGARVNSAAGTYNYAGGYDSALSFMLNGLLDFGPDDGIQGFVGGGAGVARVKSSYGLNRYGRFLDDSDTVFAYQGLAGVRAPLTSHIDATLKYRYFRTLNDHLVDVSNRGANAHFVSHSILGGVTYNFGEPAAPPTPPPPAPEPVVCSPGPFIVFFEWNKSDITPEAASILDNAVTQYQSCGNAQVMLAGFTDTSGTAKYNVGLSQRRADAVKAYMTSHAIPDAVVTTRAFGEDPAHLRVQTADGVREVQNRRVEVTYGPGSGN
ncbi:OmpA family protein [Sphingomonas sp. GC_Shp_2]|uniref:OmpA family protein n=1 Tax=Sphingomonas sp. GC_Shp_2 TaxID=2937384 RepID=UPI00226A90CC|nr:OmpA family protein [Sphingomonas sp. GC_Shp_2]